MKRKAMVGQASGMDIRPSGVEGRRHRRRLVPPAGFALVVGAAFFASSCDLFIHRDIDCRPFALAEEHYWFPASVGDSIIFVSTGARKGYMVRQMDALHTTGYKSDTGCGCHNRRATG